ncbi:N-acetylmuramoyl-L-alanine amidase [gamma proteobacterium HTCC5015]|nr:N-acetylmuramoyl-L-alanine amidase [gamma proteobacterium HTCC5015]
MRSLIKKLGYTMLLQLFAAAALAGVQVTDVRVASNNEYTRVVFDLDGPVDHSLFTLSKPERVVIDVKEASMRRNISSGELAKARVLNQLRSAARNGGDLRLVLDTNQRVRPKSFMLKPSDSVNHHRLVIDLYESDIGKTRQPVKTLPKNDDLRDVIVAIDAGHGGKDPGAVGHGGLLEKDVVLSIANKLKRHINQQKGMKAVMIRDGDYFIPLRKRIVKARQHQADMFISIHADAFPDKRASGSSVYALSINGASSEAAKWLAKRENAADLLGGVSLGDKDDLVASVLMDLSQKAAIQSSLEVGDQILGQLGRVKKLHKRKVQQAGFLVLKSPDIPSILVETAFITNPSEAKKLRDQNGQDRMARAIVRGVRYYFSKKAPPGTWLAEQNRRERGERVAALQ